MTGISIAKSLELHLLQPLVTRDDVRAGCLRAASAHLASVTVWPAHVALASAELTGSDTRVRAAIGLPYGQDMPEVKLAACDRALADGAHELSVMLEHAALAPGGDPAAASRELDRILGHAWWSALNAARGRAELTIVLETTMLDLTAMAPLFAQLHDTQAGFLQTGSGHQSRAVTEHHVRALREHLPADIAIVAVGGVASLDAATDLLAAGAVRVGTGSAVAIIDQERLEREVRHSTP